MTVSRSDPARLSDRGAVELLGLLAAGEVSAVEVVQCHLDAIGGRDGQLNAIAVARFEEALTEATAVDAARADGLPAGALAGLPVTVKECYDLAGMPTTAGAGRLRRRQKDRDAPVVAVLREAGAIVLAKTNLAQLCWGLETCNPLFGRTNNPWDTARTPGGSSGGEGAAVSAGLSPLGVGTDSGGSVRIPAHYCGIHGLKPTSGRLSSSKTVDEVLLSYQPVVVNQPGLLAREVKDLRLVYDLLASSKAALSPDAPGRRPPPERHPVVGFFAGGTGPPAPAIDRLLADAVAELESGGVEVRPFEPPSLERARELFDAAFALDRGAHLRALANGSKLSPLVEEALVRLSEATVPEGLDDAAGLLEACEDYRREFAHALEAKGVDILVCPPTAVVAHPHGMSRSLDGAQLNSQLFNLLGMPAGVVSLSRVRAGEDRLGPSGPVTDTAAAAAWQGSCGLPIGLQVAGRHFQESGVLHVMEVLESAFRRGVDYPGRFLPAGL